MFVIKNLQYNGLFHDMPKTKHRDIEYKVITMPASARVDRTIGPKQILSQGYEQPYWTRLKNGSVSRG